MARIVRPVREVYNRKGYILVIAYALAPWLFLMAARATESIFPLEEFVKFLIAAEVMATVVLIQISWGNWKVYKYCRFRKNFMLKAKRAEGYIEQSVEVFLNSRLEELSKRGDERPYWKLKIKYYNEDLAQIDTFYSDYFSEDPLKRLKTRDIDVFYEKTHVVLGNIKI